MATNTLERLQAKHCQPCEGGVPPIPEGEARRLINELSGWELTADGKRIRRQWVAKNFMAGIDFFHRVHRVAKLAEDQGHHPDLHLSGYRNVAIELWTHAIGGLSENDFILAAKINDLPIALKAK
jgi:4a-hydroxytetrahydrobiopterin dehydratase